MSVSRSGGLWSLWDMLKPFANREIFGSLTYLAQTTRRYSDTLREMDKIGPSASFTLHEHEVETLPGVLGNFAKAGEE